GVGHAAAQRRRDRTSHGSSTTGTANGHRRHRQRLLGRRRHPGNRPARQPSLRDRSDAGMPVNATPGTSRRKKIISATLVLLLLIALPAWYVFSRTDSSRTVHADFEYVNGIYVGSTVAVLGVKVGTVTAVEPRGTSVRVTMTM